MNAQSLGGVIFGLLLSVIAPIAAHAQSMQVHYIDVGQAAAAVLEFPCGAVLIDAGAQDDAHVEKLGEYLEAFFERRHDLNDTLDCVFVSHPHIDHTRGLLKVAEVCRIARYVDSGRRTGSGSFEVNWIREQVEEGLMTTLIRPVRNSEILSLPHRNGLTDDVIDPLECDDLNPQIRILQSSHPSSAGLSNDNNHSLVIRIDYGEASFLFTGDLQEEGIEILLDRYAGTDLLDTDVLHVGHHGSHNATTVPLLSAVSPELALISVGKSTYGQANSNEGGGYNTHNFGHPRRNVIVRLVQSIPTNRAAPKPVMVFRGVRDPVPFTIFDNIYATGWDGTVIVSADAEGNFDVETESPTIEASPVGPLAFAAPALELAPAVNRAARSTTGYVPPPPYDSVALEKQLRPAPESASHSVYCPTYRYSRRCCGWRRRCR